MRLLGVVGESDSGKTTLIEGLVGRLVARGRVVHAVKRTHHDVDVDRPGKDSWRHRKAGASVVALVTPTRVCVVHELGEQPQPTLIEVCRSLGPCDVVLVEGWRDGDHPRLEVAEGQVTPRVGRDGGPWSRDDLDAIADFVDAWVEDDRESQGACGA
ncbi:MAG: molybdopterin-guanine dinucleotide biosynthesis protein B [Myxococcales bacterium]|nr:molybdopterin-guanine dinucleotide biosynthesis protein B [Myxococcales bacterium]